MLKLKVRPRIKRLMEHKSKEKEKHYQDTSKIKENVFGNKKGWKSEIHNLLKRTFNRTDGLKDILRMEKKGHVKIGDKKYNLHSDEDKFELLDQNDLPIGKLVVWKYVIKDRRKVILNLIEYVVIFYNEDKVVLCGYAEVLKNLQDAQELFEYYSIKSLIEEQTEENITHMETKEEDEYDRIYMFKSAYNLITEFLKEFEIS